jgi:hypothetical protein
MNNAQLKGIVSYLTKLTHTVDMFRFKFVNVTVEDSEKLKIQYDLDITSKKDDIPWLWDFFHCKSKHIIQDGCEMVSVDWSDISSNLNNVYYNGTIIQRYGGYIPKWFEDKAHELFKANTVKSVETYFYCGNQKRILKLYLRYYGSDMYIDDGITSNITIDCIGIALDGELINITNEEILEMITGYIIEMDYIKQGLDDVIWNEINEYMKLMDCEIWTHTYVNMGTINDIPIDSYDYVSQSTFSNKMCDYINGEF